MIGQINLNTEAGDTILKIASQDDVLSIVEIGTWNGAGSTKCILEGMKNKPHCNFYTLECNVAQYTIAKSNDPGLPNVHFILGNIVSEKDLDTKNIGYQHPDEGKWLEEDAAAIRAVPNVMDRLPDIIDFLLLDGGEFSTRAEFLKLKNRSNYIFLDDTTSRKNKENRKEFECLFDYPKDRNGWSLFRRV